jgi:pyridoxamine 5'-phosphate oxidase
MTRMTHLLRKGIKAVRGLHESELAADPIDQFTRWFDEAKKTDIEYPNAMAAATCAPDGQPAVRMVLLKDYDPRGFTFFTNYESRKGNELTANPQIALLFYWEPFERQIRIEGTVEKISAAESYAYYKTRHRGSRIGAWASAQSAMIENREELEAQVKKYEAQFKEDEDVPLPPYWGGYRCVPRSFEFWQGRVNRLHDRLVYQRQDDDTWKIFRLSP